MSPPSLTGTGERFQISDLLCGKARLVDCLLWVIFRLFFPQACSQKKRVSGLLVALLPESPFATMRLDSNLFQREGEEGVCMSWSCVGEKKKNGDPIVRVGLSPGYCGPHKKNIRAVFLFLPWTQVPPTPPTITLSPSHLDSEHTFLSPYFFFHLPGHLRQRQSLSILSPIYCFLSQSLSASQPVRSAN